MLGFLEHLRYGKDVTDKVRVAAGDKIAGIAAGGGSRSSRGSRSACSRACSTGSSIPSG